MSGGRRRSSLRAFEPDGACLDLAEKFLSGFPALATPENTEELAYVINEAIEEFIQSAEPSNGQNRTGGDSKEAPRE